jgi:hypothetical protein
MTEIIVLNDWRFDVRRDGRFYVIGTLYNGTRWETTQVHYMQTHDNCYEVHTMNTIYILYW